MIKRVNQNGVMIPQDAANGHVWWVTNPVESSVETNLIKKDRPFLIINIEPSYTSYKVNGIMLQTRSDYVLGRYEHVLDMSKSGRYSVVDCSNITTINLENLKNHIYQVEPCHMRIISSIINSMVTDHYKIRQGQVWQYKDMDCVVYDISVNNATHMQEVVTLLPIACKKMDDLVLDDIVVGMSAPDDSYYVVTVGTAMEVLVVDLIAYKYSISDVTVGKIVEGHTKMSTIKALIARNPVLKETLYKTIKTSKSNKSNKSFSHSRVKQPNTNDKVFKKPDDTQSTKVKKNRKKNSGK